VVVAVHMSDIVGIGQVASRPPLFHDFELSSLFAVEASGGFPELVFFCGPLDSFVNWLHDSHESVFVKEIPN